MTHDCPRGIAEQSERGTAAPAPAFVRGGWAFFVCELIVNGRWRAAEETATAAEVGE